MNELTNDQKIEILKLAADCGTFQGAMKVDADVAVTNYDKLVAAITKEQPLRVS